ncbi:hypothetical protein [Nocardia macrotermitis]|uniref:hypothetical protein n=1 Tax=Nocardia macrotermitis TaxID=2585198 RepID=UPI001D11B0BC|nr:hypothetical protein [Nocardia macrotermitis]
MFDQLMERAERVQVMGFDDAGAEAYEAANEVVVGLCDRLIAVWDGESGSVAVPAVLSRWRVSAVCR